MRATAVWRAHDNAILGISDWGPDKIITHGRDNKLIAWKLTSEDETALSTILPLDPSPEPRTKPWLVHLLEVNTMNFCSFASGPASPPANASDVGSSASYGSELLIAVPNTLASEAVDIYGLPSQARLHTVKLGQENGMVMALALVWVDGVLTLVVGYENGLAVVARLDDDGSWFTIYRSQCHNQPILSLDVAPNLEYFLTSSADAIIAKHPLPLKRSYVAGLTVDVTETGSSAVEHGDTDSTEVQDTEQQLERTKPRSGLSAALASHTPPRSSKPISKIQVQTQPLKTVKTKHSGQQGLKVRSDGRIFATAGWDSKVRVYSSKTLREVAVLKWHPVGCFAAAFADLAGPTMAENARTETRSDDDGASSETKLVPRMLEMTVKDRRISQVKNAHWLAAGSKDGKVSLWDIY